MQFKCIHHTLKHQLYPMDLPNSGLGPRCFAGRHQYICQAKVSSSISPNQNVSAKKKRITPWKNNESESYFFEKKENKINLVLL